MKMPVFPVSKTTTDTAFLVLTSEPDGAVSITMQRPMRLSGPPVLAADAHLDAEQIAALRYWLNRQQPATTAPTPVEVKSDRDLLPGV